jgi:hypothetical protein
MITKNILVVLVPEHNLVREIVASTGGPVPIFKSRQVLREGTIQINRGLAANRKVVGIKGAALLQAVQLPYPKAGTDSSADQTSNVSKSTCGRTSGENTLCGTFFFGEKMLNSGGPQGAGKKIPCKAPRSSGCTSIP